jgi:ParB family chromosome partitioning protein
MKKTLSRSLLKPTLNPAPTKTSEPENGLVPESREAPTEARETVAKPRIGGAGSAWKAGAAEQSKAALLRSREKMASDILRGRHELSLEPGNVVDSLGSDRRADWKDQEAFRSLKKSIEANGQDTPIQVWPADPMWVPDALEPDNVDGVQFELITGRRRHAIASSLGIKLRAILASPEKRGVPDEHFERLFMRFRENEERENLSPFERLLSIGEMFEDLKAGGASSGVTAVSFANRIGVHESIISRGRAIYKARDAILNKFKNAYDLSFPDLQKAVSSLSEANRKTPTPKAKSQKIIVTRKIGTKKLSVSTQSGRLSVSAAGTNLDKEGLEGLSDLIATYLQEQGSKQ